MGTFRYEALTSSGRLMKGAIEAGSRDEASELLERMELKVNSVEKSKPEKLKTAIGRNEFMLFNQQLASITKAGIPLERGLRELADDVSSRSMRKLIKGIADELEAGVSIEDAFEKRQKQFPPLYGRILKAGVETGRLSEMLTSLNRHLDMSNHTRRIIFEAISYPLVVLAIAAMIITFVFLFLIPPFGPVLTEMTGGSHLPALTRMFLAMAENVIPFWIGVGIVIAAIIGIISIISRSPAGRRFRESVMFKIPVMGMLYRSSILSKMSEAMAILVSSGADMATCLRLSSTAAGSDSLVLESEVLAGQVEQGNNILEAGQFCKQIPKLFLYSIQLGTQRNELGDNLYSLAQMYAEQARCGQARLQSVLLPVMLIFVGGFIFLTILSIFLPMIQIVTTLSGA